MEKVKFIVGITGGSGVGKTTLIDGLYKEFKGHVATFSLDNYYLPKEQQQVDENGVINFDLPSALDLHKMKEDYDNLLAGNSIEQEIYTFNNPSDRKETQRIDPKNLLIVEGLFVMHYEFIRASLDYAVYISVDPEIQLERRLVRDVEERNYSKEDVIYQWENHVKPSYENFVLPYKPQVDLIITNNKAFDENIHILTSVIHQNLD
ncbi:MAG: AAA family ATPase [Crocinitomicaceae bacterium]